VEDDYGGEESLGCVSEAAGIPGRDKSTVARRMQMSSQNIRPRNRLREYSRTATSVNTSANMLNSTTRRWRPREGLDWSDSGTSIDICHQNAVDTFVQRWRGTWGMCRLMKPPNLLIWWMCTDEVWGEAGRDPSCWELGCARVVAVPDFHGCQPLVRRCNLVDRPRRQVGRLACGESPPGRSRHLFPCCGQGRLYLL
jgi:hypothetical protein